MGLNKLVITNAEDIKDSDFACSKDVFDGGILDLSFMYDTNLKTFSIYRTDGSPINITSLRSIHFGQKDLDLNMCALETQYYRFKVLPDLTSNKV